MISSNGNSLGQKEKTFQGQRVTEDFGLNVHEWKYRVSDPAIGRFWQIDPLAEKYNWMTTYQFSSNQPIHAPELEGLESSLDLNHMDIGKKWAKMDKSQRTQYHKEMKPFRIGGAFVMGALTGGMVVSIFGVEASAVFVANEIKDEVLSQATGGASDYLDITKIAGKILKKGFKKVSGKTVNKTFTDAGGMAPYDEAYDVIEGVTEGTESFVRVHGDGNKVSKWMMKASEIEGLSAEQIKDKFALPSLPTHISDVNLPKGTKIRTGVAGKVKDWGNGGGVQIELQQRIAENAFTNTRKIQ